jgi:hypothetical protein
MLEPFLPWREIFCVRAQRRISIFLGASANDDGQITILRLAPAKGPTTQSRISFEMCCTGANAHRISVYQTPSRRDSTTPSRDRPEWFLAQLRPTSPKFCQCMSGDAHFEELPPIINPDSEAMAAHSRCLSCRNRTEDLISW